MKRKLLGNRKNWGLQGRGKMKRQGAAVLPGGLSSPLLYKSLSAEWRLSQHSDVLLPHFISVSFFGQVACGILFP